MNVVDRNWNFLHYKFNNELVVQVTFDEFRIIYLAQGAFVIKYLPIVM